MRGKIMKGVGGFYYVCGSDGVEYACRARGIFRKEGVKPLVGDDVEIEILSREEREGSLCEIYDRKNALIRPAVANIDQALVIFAICRPDPDLNLLDKFLIMMEQQGLPVAICFNKLDIAADGQQERLAEIYGACGYQVLFTSALRQEGLPELSAWLAHKTTAVAGPSGVGKSSLVNALQSGIWMETGELSSKLSRGKHTTRYTRLIATGNDAYIMDTPGFSSLALFDMEAGSLRHCYGEFLPYEDTCRFQGCVHVDEPGCEVKEAVAKGLISPARYDSYVSFYRELQEKDKRRYEKGNRQK